jgi:hypothetical protein
VGEAAYAAGAALDPGSTIGPLSVEELEDLVAFGEILVKGETFATAERRLFVEYIEDQTGRRPEFLAAYRTTVQTLGVLAGRRFASLGIRERTELVDHHHLADRQLGPEPDVGQFPTEIRTIRTRVAKDLIGGYYGSSAGWAVVGYQTFPGRCGDVRRYTRAES